MSYTLLKQSNFYNSRFVVPVITYNSSLLLSTGLTHDHNINMAATKC